MLLSELCFADFFIESFPYILHKNCALDIAKLSPSFSFCWDPKLSRLDHFRALKHKESKQVYSFPKNLQIGVFSLPKILWSGEFYQVLVVKLIDINSDSGS